MSPVTKLSRHMLAQSGFATLRHTGRRQIGCGMRFLKVSRFPNVSRGAFPPKQWRCLCPLSVPSPRALILQSRRRTRKFFITTMFPNRETKSTASRRFPKKLAARATSTRPRARWWLRRPSASRRARALRFQMLRCIPKHAVDVHLHLRDHREALGQEVSNPRTPCRTEAGARVGRACVRMSLVCAATRARATCSALGGNVIPPSSTW